MDKITILCATDNNYVQYCGIMLTSVFINHPLGSVEVYILLDQPLSPSNTNKFNKLACKYSNKLNFIQVDDSQIRSIQIQGMPYWTKATYYRLYAANLLPKSVNKILYLDCDIIVNGNLSQLWQMNWEGISAGVVPDIFNEDNRNYELLSYDKELGYFNAGVIFMNLEYWRENRIGEACFEYLISNSQKLKSNDQDVLNYILKESKKNLPLSYNFQIQYLSKSFRAKVFSNSFIKEIDNIHNPLIIHYAAPIKPWMANYYKMPYGLLWHKYKRESFWRFISDIWPESNYIKFFFKRFIMWPLNIRRPSNPFIPTT